MIVWPSFFALISLVSGTFASIVVRPFVAVVVFDSLWEAVVFLFFIVSPCRHHIALFCDGLGSLMTEVSEDVIVEKTLMVVVDDVCFGDFGNGSAFLKETLCVVL